MIYLIPVDRLKSHTTLTHYAISYINVLQLPNGQNKKDTFTSYRIYGLIRPAWPIKTNQTKQACLTYHSITLNTLFTQYFVWGDQVCCVVLHSIWPFGPHPHIEIMSRIFIGHLYFNCQTYNHMDGRHMSRLQRCGIVCPLFNSGTSKSSNLAQMQHRQAFLKAIQWLRRQQWRGSSKSCDGRQSNCADVGSKLL